MTRASRASSLQFGSLVFGQGVYADHLQEIEENQAYASAHNPEHLAGCLLQGYLVVPFGGGLVEWFAGRVLVDPALQVIRLAVRASIPADATGVVTIEVGAETETVTLVGPTDPDDVHFVDIDAAAAGSGVLEMALSTELTVGSGIAGLLAWSLFGLPIPDGDLPAPPDE